MKKLLAICLALVMTCSVMTACNEKDAESQNSNNSSVSDSSSTNNDSSKDNSSKDDDSTTPDVEVSLSGNAETPLGETVGDEIEVDTSAFDDIANLNTAEAFTFDVFLSLNADGVSMEMPMVISTDGNSTYTNVNMLGINAVSLMTDGKTYYIDDTNKVYYVEDGIEEGATDGILDSMDMSSFTDISDSIKSANKVTIDGAEFERYLATAEEGDVCIYVANGKLVYFADETTLLTINEISDKPRTDLFEIPSDYKEVSEEEYSELMYGDLGLDVTE